MADLQAELARFEAELGGTGAFSTPAPTAQAPTVGVSPPAPQIVAGPTPAGAPPPAAVTPPPQHQQVHAPAVPLPLPGMPPPGMLPPGFPPPFPPPMFPPPMIVPMPQQQPQPQQQAYHVGAAPPGGGAASYAGQATAAAASQEAKLAGVREALAAEQPNKEKPPALHRAAAGKNWWDSSMLDWPENDFRIFVGDMGPEVTDEVLCKAFQHYASFQMGRMVKDKRNHKNKGYGFASFADAAEGARALREMDGKYIGNRPCKLRKSSWQERNSYKGKGGRGGRTGRGGRGGGRSAGVLHK